LTKVCAGPRHQELRTEDAKKREDSKLRIGVLGIQGAIEEHIASTNQALKESGREGETVVVKKPEEVKIIDGLIILAGDSTVIGYTLYSQASSAPSERG